MFFKGKIFENFQVLSIKKHAFGSWEPVCTSNSCSEYLANAFASYFLVKALLTFYSFTCRERVRSPPGELMDSPKRIPTICLSYMNISHLVLDRVY